ncbi:MAG: MurR/RpiR family transcriptional regulator [Halioglobus sp.]
MKNDENAFPPSSFSDLRQIPLLIGRGDLALPMGKQSYSALCQMMDNPEMVAMNNISSLADVLRVSPPTLTRLAKLLGFSGFPDLQRLFRKHLVEPDHFYSGQAARLANKAGVSAPDVLQTLADEATGNIASANALLEPGQLDTCAQWLATGVRVHVFGYRQSASLASLMGYGLSMIRGNVQQLGANGQGLSVGLSQINRSDIVVLLSSSPYSRETVAAARLADRRHARLIAITDSHLSPLAQWADITLTLPTNSSFYSNSMCATVFVVEGLLTLTAKYLGQKAVANLESREQLISELNDQY